MSRTYSSRSRSYGPYSDPVIIGWMLLPIALFLIAFFVIPDVSAGTQESCSTPTVNTVTIESTSIPYTVCGSWITATLPWSDSYCKATVNTNQDVVDCTNPSTLRLINKLAVLPFKSIEVDGDWVRVGVVGRMEGQHEMNFRNSLMLVYDEE